MTEHSDLTSVIAWLEAGCDPAEAAKELRSYQAALSSQSLSLSEAIGRGDRYERIADEHRSLIGELKPALSEAREEIERLRAPREGAIGWNSDAEWEIEQRAFHAAGRDDVPKDVQELVAILWKQYCIAAEPVENGPALLADAHTNPPLSDLSSLRKVAEVAGWRPMSTAPKDGTRIDAWVRSTEQPGKEYRHCGAYWNAVQGEWQLGSYHVGQFEHRPEVTHWMPIPERPIDAALVLAAGRMGRDAS